MHGCGLNTKDGSCSMSQKQCLALAFAAICAAYLLQLNSPLRLNTDAQHFLALAASYLDGHGFKVDGKPTHFPVGYPLILAALSRTGLGSAAGLIGLNLVMVALGCVGAACVMRQSFRFTPDVIGAVGVLTLLSWVVVKHATIPLSDVSYFGISMICLAVLQWSAVETRSRRYIGLAVGAILVIAAIAVRTVGIALVPALAISCAPVHAWATIPAWYRRNPVRGSIAFFVIIAAAIAGAVGITQTGYFQEMLSYWSGWDKVCRIRLEDWGELVINTSMAKLPSSLQRIVPCAGAIGALLVCCGAVRRAKLGAADLYTACYTAILVVWPWRDGRFWLPVFPLFAAYAWLALATVTNIKWVRELIFGYLVMFVLMGCAALFYSSQISLAGERFAELYGGGTYRDSYRAFSTPEAKEGRTAAGDPKLIRLLERYGSGIPVVRRAE
jgi:hypothetical protein